MGQCSEYPHISCSASRGPPGAPSSPCSGCMGCTRPHTPSNCELEGGGGDMGFDPSDYEGIEELPSVTSTSSLLLPHVKAAQIVYHYEQQE